MIMANGPLWYAVHTHPREEFKALSHLRRQDYRVYLPCYAKKSAMRRKTSASSDRFSRAIFSYI